MCRLNAFGTAALVVVGAACRPGEPDGSGAPDVEHSAPESRQWMAVEAGCYFTCGIDLRGRVACWGMEGVGTTENYDGTYLDSHVRDEVPDVGFSSIALAAAYADPGDFRACGVLLGGGARCWGAYAGEAGQPPPGTYVSVGATEYNSVGLTSEGRVVVWDGGESPPAGSYTAVSAGDLYGLAIDDSGGVVQWNLSGAKPPWGPDLTNEGEFTAIAAGKFACAVSIGGTLSCWYGSPEDALLASGFPEEPVTDVCVSGWSFGCALGTDRRAYCFSDRSDTFALVSPTPDEEFTQITCGSSHACGVTPDHRIVCWGDLSHGEGTPPD